MSVLRIEDLMAEKALSQARAAVQALCVADAASRNLGIEIVSVDPGQVQVTMTVRPEMLNSHGSCHGGIVFACADSAFAFACNSYRAAMVASGASMEYFAPVALGERITTTARETSRTERNGIYDGDHHGVGRGGCAMPRALCAVSP